MEVETAPLPFRVPSLAMLHRNLVAPTCAAALPEGCVLHLNGQDTQAQIATSGNHRARGRHRMGEGLDSVPDLAVFETEVRVLACLHAHNYWWRTKRRRPIKNSYIDFYFLRRLALGISSSEGFEPPP